ncbi:putative motility protein [Salinicola halophilus]|uniref:putative motility protein n=1 Tax=Salinicola halophilus TaxID=184065 RepID=UPI000DA20285|nr:putative motility protein [Salinicola halophilus]
MDTAVNAVVGNALALQSFNQGQEVQNNLLKQSLDGQAAHMDQLLSSIDLEPALASSGSLGTQINTFA